MGISGPCESSICCCWYETTAGSSEWLDAPGRFQKPLFSTAPAQSWQILLSGLFPTIHCVEMPGGKGEKYPRPKNCWALTNQHEVGCGVKQGGIGKEDYFGGLMWWKPLAGVKKPGFRPSL